MNQPVGVVYVLFNGAARAWPFYVTETPQAGVDVVDWIRTHSDGQRVLLDISEDQIVCSWYSPAKPAGSSTRGRLTSAEQTTELVGQAGGAMTLEDVAKARQLEPVTIERQAKRSDLLELVGAAVALSDAGKAWYDARMSEGTLGR